MVFNFFGFHWLVYNMVCICYRVSLGVVPPLQAQRQDLIAELKMSKDINGIKKMKVEKVKMDEMSEKQKINEITKQLSPDNIIDQVFAYKYTININN